MTLADALTDWAPSANLSTELLTPGPALKLAAVLSCATPNTSPGAPVPLMWHWLYLLDQISESDLGEDGHPREGGLLPPIQYRRRMFAGGRVETLAPLRFGEQVQRSTRVINREMKSGRTGELLFVTTESQFRVGDELRLREEQDIVYRSGNLKHPSVEPSPESRPIPTANWNSGMDTNEVLLFRFSALTFNAHRIHYDKDYAVGVEGFPGLVVHGPLLAIALAELARASAPNRVPGKFSFRALRAVFCGTRLELRGDPDGHVAQLAAYGADGHPAMTAAVTFRDG
jgi:3-methylfumaryl-CoA hydratase